jgi:hypothetical protein
MGLLDSILGGSESTSTQTLFEPQSSFLSNLYYPALSDLFKTGELPGFDPLQIQGQESQLQAANQFGGMMPGAYGALNTLFGAADPNSPLTQGAIQAATSPIFENFQNVIAPSLRRHSLGNQPGGGTRLTSRINQAGQEALRTAGNVGKQIALQAHQQGLGAVGQGLGLAPSVFGLGQLPGQLQQQIGAQRRDLSNPFNFLSQIQNLFGQPITLGSSTSSSSGGLVDLFNLSFTRPV